MLMIPNNCCACEVRRMFDKYVLLLISYANMLIRFSNMDSDRTDKSYIKHLTIKWKQWDNALPTEAFRKNVIHPKKDIIPYIFSSWRPCQVLRHSNGADAHTRTHAHTVYGH